MGSGGWTEYREEMRPWVQAVSLLPPMGPQIDINWLIPSTVFIPESRVKS